MFSLCSAQSSKQKTEAVQKEITPLQIGDTIPEELWNIPLQVVNHPQAKNTLTLKDYRKKKLIVIDFWTTYCAPCIRSLNRLDSIQRNENDLAVLPVSPQKDLEIFPRIKNKWIIPSVVSDSILSKYFPSAAYPNQIWIKDNTIISITNGEYGTQKNIRNFLEGEEVKFINRGADYKISRNEFLKRGFETALKEGNHFMIRGVFPRVKANIQGGGGFATKPEEFAIYNIDPLALIQLAYSDSIIYNVESDFKTILEIDDDKLEKLQYPGIMTGEYKHDLALEKALDTTLFNYVNITPVPISRAEQFKAIKEDVNIFFGAKFNIVAGLELRSRPCYVLKRITGKFELPKLNKLNEPIVSFTSISKMLKYIQGQNRDIQFPFLDETGVEKGVELQMPKILKGMPAIEQHLKRYGLFFTKENRMIKVLVIKDKNREGI